MDEIETIFSKRHEGHFCGEFFKQLTASKVEKKSLPPTKHAMILKTLLISFPLNPTRSNILQDVDIKRLMIGGKVRVERKRSCRLSKT